MSNHNSRFELVSRRAFMKGSLAVGFLAAVPLAACGNDDSSALATSTTAPVSGPTVSSGAAPEPGSVTPTDAPTATAAGSSPSSTAPASAGDTFPSGGKLVVDFTYTAAASGGPRVNNPYIAVWIEDADGALVRTVSLWFKRAEAKYLQELKRWYAVDQGGATDNAVDTVSGATRVAGTASVMWDGTDGDGSPVAQGTYFVCIEAAREHGPYELVRGPIDIASTATTVQLTANGELTAASAMLLV